MSVATHPHPRPAVQPSGALRLAVAGFEHEWPADFEAFLARELVARDGASVDRLADISQAPALLAASGVTALIVNADRLGVKGMLAVRECRKVSPATAVVAVATKPARGVKDALEGGATAFVSWPVAADVLRRALWSGRGHADGAGPRAGRKAAAEIDAMLRLVELDSSPEADARQRRTLSGRLSREALEAYSRARRGGRQPAVVAAVDGVCRGCFVRLHAKLAHQLRVEQALGWCPHCLRVLYDPARLDPVPPAAEDAEAAKHQSGH